MKTPPLYAAVTLLLLAASFFLPLARASAQQADAAPLSGTAELPLSGFTPRPGRVLVVDVLDGAGRRAATFGGAPNAAGNLEWDTRAVPDGVYTLRLIVLDETSGDERVADSRVVAVSNRAAAARRDVRRPAPPAARRAAAALASRGTAAVLPPLRGTRQQQFRAIAQMSRALGDPHPEIAAAQWALESGWGRSPSGAFNYFGIKAAGGQAGTPRDTREWEDGGWVTVRARFADYASPEEGVAARLAFLKKPRYGGYWEAASREEAARALQAAGYATDPGYAGKLLGVLRQVGVL